MLEKATAFKNLSAAKMQNIDDKMGKWAYYMAEYILSDIYNLFLPLSQSLHHP